MEARNLKSLVERLKKRRAMLGKKLDEAYLREDVSSYISLEERYKRLARTIERLLYRLRSKGANVQELERN